MHDPHDEATGSVTWRTVAEIVAGYVLILGLIALLFGTSGGIDIEMPWRVMTGILLLGLLLAAAAWRRARRR